MTQAAIRTLRAPADLDSIRSYWEQWQSHINNDLGQFELVCRLRPDVIGAVVVVVEHDGLPQTLIAARLEQSVFAPAIGYFKPLKIPARMLVVIHQGVIGQDMDATTARACVAHLRGLLRERMADAVEFHHLDDSSPLAKELLQERAWLQVISPRSSIHREMNVPRGSFMEHKLRSKHRSSIRKRARELEAAFPGLVEWRWMTSFNDISSLCSELEGVAARTYQRGLGAGFRDNEEFRRRFELFAGRGQLRVQALVIDGRMRAFWFGFVYRGVFHSSETGYDPDLREYEPGTLMFIRMADELAREGVERVDFGLGDAAYKERYGDREWREAPCWLFAPSFKGFALMLVLRMFTLLDTYARNLVEKSGMTDRLKTSLRRMLGRSLAKSANMSAKQG